MFIIQNHIEEEKQIKRKNTNNYQAKKRKNKNKTKKQNFKQTAKKNSK